MRITAGTLKGRKLELPPGSKIRPATGAVLEAAMSLFTARRLESGPFVDICAGSGLVGFEALSRGAQHVVFVETDGPTAGRIRRVAQDFGVADQATVLRIDARRCAGRLERQLGRRSVPAVFLDPPFIPGMAQDLLERIGMGSGFMAPDGLLILRTPDSVDTKLSGLELIEERQAGSARFWLFRPDLAAEETSHDG